MFVFMCGDGCPHLHKTGQTVIHDLSHDETATIGLAYSERLFDFLEFHALDVEIAFVFDLHEREVQCNLDETVLTREHDACLDASDTHAAELTEDCGALHLALALVAVFRAAHNLAAARVAEQCDGVSVTIGLHILGKR